LRAADHLEIVQEIAIVREECGDGFGGVECAAAAETNDEIAIRRSGMRDTAANVSYRGLSGNCKAGGGKLRGREEIEEVLGTGGVASRDDERALTKLAGDSADVGQSSCAEYNPRGGGEFETHQYSGSL
jgi:hypothetical protein